MRRTWIISLISVVQVRSIACLIGVIQAQQEVKMVLWDG